MTSQSSVTSERNAQRGSKTRVPDTEDFNEFAEFRLALFEFQRRSEAVLETFDIGNRQFYAMLIIKNGSGRQLVTVGKVARGMGIHPSSASGLIARLEGAGLAERIFDLENRRKVRVKLTAQGEQLLAEIITRDAEKADDLRQQCLELLQATG